jgi:hypothetical protein
MSGITFIGEYFSARIVLAPISTTSLKLRTCFMIKRSVAEEIEPLRPSDPEIAPSRLITIIARTQVPSLGQA